MDGLIEKEKYLEPENTVRCHECLGRDSRTYLALCVVIVRTNKAAPKAGVAPAACSRVTAGARPKADPGSACLCTAQYLSI